MEEKKIISIDITQSNQFPVVEATLKVLEVCNNQLKENGCQLLKLQKCIFEKEELLTNINRRLDLSERNFQEKVTALETSEFSLQEKTASLEACEHSLQEKTAFLGACEHSLQEKTASLEACEHSLQEKTTLLEACEHSLQEKSASLEACEHSLQEKSASLEACEHSLQEKSASLGACEHSLQDLENSMKLKQVKEEEFLFCMLKQICQLIKLDIPNCVNENLRGYLVDICENGSTDTPSLDKYISIEQIKRSFNYGNTPITKCASLVWWYEQEAIYPQLKILMSRIDEIYGMFKFLFIPAIRYFYNFDIQLPNSYFSKSIEGYSNYENGATNLKMIFEDLSIDNYTLCEIYLLRKNDKKGSCYIFYK